LSDPTSPASLRARHIHTHQEFIMRVLRTAIVAAAILLPFGAHAQAPAKAAVQKQGRALAKKLGVTPTPVAKDFALKVDYDATMKKLRGLKGVAFDKAFLEHEVAYHKAVIDAVTNAFLPAIKNAELKAFVQKVAPAFQAHMVAAQALLDAK